MKPTHAILTFSSAHNFGAQLQCFALVEILRSFGHNPVVVNYRPNYLLPYSPALRFRDIANRHVASLPDKLRHWHKWRTVNRPFERFQKLYLPLTKTVTNQKELDELLIESGCPQLLIGSDQVWNPAFNGSDSVWFTPGANAIAPSAGNISKWMQYAGDIRHRLMELNRLTAREDELAEALDHLLNRKKGTTPVLADPTLLTLPATWEKFSTVRNLPLAQKKITGRYILIYQARESDHSVRIAKELQHQAGFPEIIALDNFENLLRNGIRPLHVSPEVFVSLVKHAACVVTTSFHATVFSILLQTPVYPVRLDDGADARIESLLNSLDMPKLLIDKSDSPLFSPVDFTPALERLDEIRNKHRNLLYEITRLP